MRLRPPPNLFGVIKFEMRPQYHLDAITTEFTRQMFNTRSEQNKDLSHELEVAL